MEASRKEMKVGSLCKQKTPISPAQSNLRYVIKEIKGDKVSCYDTSEPEYTYRNIPVKELIVI